MSVNICQGWDLPDCSAWQLCPAFLWVMSFWSMAFLGSSTIGGPIVGWFGEFIGPRWGLAAGGLAALAAAAIGWLTIGRPQIRKGRLGPGWGPPKNRLSVQKHS
ncbi:MAG: hypothetical protein P8Y03_25120 [Anaerolineales bacterium]